MWPPRRWRRRMNPSRRGQRVAVLLVRPVAAAQCQQPGGAAEQARPEGEHRVVVIIGRRVKAGKIRPGGFEIVVGGTHWRLPSIAARLNAPATIPRLRRGGG